MQYLFILSQHSSNIAALLLVYLSVFDSLYMLPIQSPLKELVYCTAFWGYPRDLSVIIFPNEGGSDNGQKERNNFSFPLFSFSPSELIGSYFFTGEYKFSDKVKVRFNRENTIAFLRCFTMKVSSLKYCDKLTLYCEVANFFISRS